MIVYCSQFLSIDTQLKLRNGKIKERRDSEATPTQINFILAFYTHLLFVIKFYPFN